MNLQRPFMSGVLSQLGRMAKKLSLNIPDSGNVNSVIPQNVVASDFLTDCHQALFYQQDTLVY